MSSRSDNMTMGGTLVLCPWQHREHGERGRTATGEFSDVANLGSFSENDIMFDTRQTCELVHLWPRLDLQDALPLHCCRYAD